MPLPEENDAADGLAMPASDVNPESETIIADQKQVLSRLVASLPEEHRTVLMLREIEEMDYAQIAAVIDVPIGTVMSRLARSRAALKAKWLQESKESRVQCAESLRVQAYFDREVDAVSAAEMERHVEHCGECRELLQDLEKVRNALRSGMSYATAPAALRAQILEALDRDALKQDTLDRDASAAKGDEGANSATLRKSPPSLAANGAHNPGNATRSGYHLAYWQQGDIQYCAVSDTGWDELLGLVRLLRAQT